jgi:radical SAM superfamily enzyme YgiQ (UPF0313 family)
MPSISIVNQIPGRKIEPDSLKTVNDCILLANNESFQSGKYAPSIGLYFLKENLPSADILEYPQWEDYAQAIKRGYDVVGIGFYTTNYYDAVKMAKMAREAGVKEVWAGNYGALTPGAEDVFDRIFIGYAERELKSALENEVLEMVRHPILATPFRALSRRKKAGYLVTTRGCKYKCRFCSTPIFSSQTDEISMAEIERLLDIYRNMDIDYVIIADETFLQDRVQAKRVIGSLHKRNMKWFCTSRADLLFGRVKELRENGLDGVYLGIESMQNVNLKVHKKGESTQTLIEVLNELKQSNVSASGTYMLGFNNDTVSSIMKDLEMLNRLPLYVLVFLVLTPYPELPLYREWKRSGLISNDNWQDYDGMHLVFRHPSINPEEMRKVFEYAVCNIYSPFNYNKRRALHRLNQIRHEMADKARNEKGVPHIGLHS